MELKERKMKYIVIEIQASDENVATLTNQYDTENEAESKFHTILASASLSSVPRHSAIILSDNGAMLKSECYYHESTVDESVD